MALSDISKKVRNNVSRQAEVFIRPAGGGNWSTLGQVAEVGLTTEAVTSDNDTAGRAKQFSHDVELTYQLLQTSDTEIGATDDMVNQEVDLFFSTKTGVKAGDIDTGSGGNGYLFRNALVNVDADLDFTGDQSMLAASSGGRVSTEEFARLGSNRTLRFGD